MKDILALLAIQQGSAGPESNFNYYSLVGGASLSGNGDTTCIQMSPDGTKVFIKFSMASGVRQYNLSTAFDISTIDSTNYFELYHQQSFEKSFCFADNGTSIYTFAGSVARKYFLTGAYDFSQGNTPNTGNISANIIIANNPGSAGAQIYAGCFNASGNRFYAIGASSTFFGPGTFGIYGVNLNPPFQIENGNDSNPISGPANFKAIPGIVPSSNINVFIDKVDTSPYLVYSVDTGTIGYNTLEIVSDGESLFNAVDTPVSPTALTSGSGGSSSFSKRPGDYYEQGGNGYFLTHDGMALQLFKGPPLAAEVTVTEGVASSIFVNQQAGPGTLPNNITLYFNTIADFNKINDNLVSAESTIEVVYQGTKYSFMVGNIYPTTGGGSYELMFSGISEYSQTYVGYPGGPGSNNVTVKLITYVRDSGGGGGTTTLPFYRYYFDYGSSVTVEFQSSTDRDNFVVAAASIGSVTLDGFNSYAYGPEMISFTSLGPPSSTGSYYNWSNNSNVYYVSYVPASYNIMGAGNYGEGQGIATFSGGGGGGGGGGPTPPPGGAAIDSYFASPMNSFLRLNFTSMAQRADALNYIDNLPNGSYGYFYVYGLNEAGGQENYGVTMYGNGYSMGDFVDPNTNIQVYFASFSGVSLGLQGSNAPGYSGIV